MLGALALRFALRVLALSSRVKQAFARLEARAQKMESDLGVNDPIVLPQALAVLGALAIALVCWHYRDLISAWAGSFVNISAADRFLPLQTSNGQRVWYRIVLSVLTLSFGIGLVQVFKLRRRRNITQDRGGLIALVAVIVVMVLMTELPYRIFHTESERIDYAGLRCYAIGKDGADLLMFCPDASPPRNHVIKSNDPSLHRQGIVENVFTPERR
jgi:hypothetical protein